MQVLLKSVQVPAAIRLDVIVMNGLAEVVPDIDGICVLDLACGSGPLLKILYDRNKNLKLKGVDISREELALAKARLPNSAVDLFELKAQNLTAIDDNSVDIVLCHWALTLNEPNYSSVK